MADFAIEAELLKINYRRICGLDEVGRGCLFGPVVSGAVILDPRRLNHEYKDSKKLAPAQRVRLAHDIYEKALAYSIGWCWNDDIDRSNILEATKQSMLQAVRRLQVEPDYVLIDAITPDFLPIRGRAIIRGDERACPSPPRLSSPRFSVTFCLKNSPISSRNTDWPKTRAILPKNIKMCYYFKR